MPYGYFLLLICYLIMLGLSWWLARRRFSPSIALYATWIISLSLLAVGACVDGYEAPPLERPVFTYLLLAGMSHLAGAFFAHSLGRIKHSRAASVMTNSDPPPEDFYRRGLLGLLAAIALVFALLHIHREIPNLRVFIANAGSIRDEITDPSNLRPALFSTLATYSAMVVVPVAGLYWLRRRSINWWMISAVSAAVLLALVTVGKFFFIFAGLTFVNMGFYSQNASRRRRIRLGPLIAAAATILLAFAVVSELRSRRETVGSAPVLGLVHTIYIYATGYIPAFGHFYQEYRAGELTTFPTNPDYRPENERFGNQTFSGIYRLLAKLNVVKESASNKYEGRFNVYTIHRDLIMDFGVIGGLSFIFLAGFGLTLLVRLLDQRRPNNILLLSLLTTQMQFSLIYSLFGFIFYPLVLILSPLLVRSISKNHRIPSTSPAVEVFPSDRG